MLQKLDIPAQICDQQSMVLHAKVINIVKNILTVSRYHMHNFGAASLTKRVLTLAYMPYLLNHLDQTMTLVMYSISIQILLTILLNCKQQSVFETSKLN